MRAGRGALQAPRPASARPPATAPDPVTAALRFYLIERYCGRTPLAAFTATGETLGGIAACGAFVDAGEPFGLARLPEPARLAPAPRSVRLSG